MSTEEGTKRAGWFEGFDEHWTVGSQMVSGRIGGKSDGPPLLLLHGFPETHVMWHRVAAALRDRYLVVLLDIRGYGQSSKPDGLPDHSNYSKRAMANDAIGVMDALGLDRFLVCGHDRGGRVGHRMALDHPHRVSKLCVVDIAPTLDMYAATDMAFATAYYHWFHLIQPSPLPESMIGGDASTYLHAVLGGWGSGGLRHIESRALAEYEHSFTGDAIHAMCEDYRASAGIDLVHDQESRDRGDKIRCDTHVLWGERGVIHRLFEPLQLWQGQCLGAVTGHPMPAGHFIPEELPSETAQALDKFFGAGTTAEG